MSGEIDNRRRWFLFNAAMTVAAAGLGMTASANPSSNINRQTEEL